MNGELFVPISNGPYVPLDANANHHPVVNYGTGSFCGRKVCHITPVCRERLILSGICAGVMLFIGVIVVIAIFAKHDCPPGQSYSCMSETPDIGGGSTAVTYCC